MSLNPRQIEAVEHSTGPLLVVAGAGSGKTRVLVHRVARLLDEGGIAPWELLVVTFTNKAARELVERTRAMVGPAAEDLWVGTFHGIAARMLRRHADRLGYPNRFTILDTDDQVRLLRDIVRGRGWDDKTLRPEAIRAVIDAAKNEGKGYEQLERDADEPFAVRAASVYREYQERMLKAGGMDFGDLLTNVVRLLTEEADLAERYRRQFRHVLVDEYQDTNRVQYAMVRALAAEHGNLCVVGDDDQSIYGWRGADLRNILEFDGDFPGAKVVRLEQNYRSSRNIIDAAAELISNNADRRDKKMWTDNAPGARIVVYGADTDREEARYVIDALDKMGSRRSDAAVFYRTNAQSRTLEEALIRANIRYTIIGGIRFYERREVKDLIAYLRVISNPNDDLSLERIVNVPARGIGRVTWERLRAVALETGAPVWELLERGELAGIGPAAKRKLLAFRDMVRPWLADASGDIAPLVRRVIEDTGYVAHLESRPDEAEGRLENIGELVSVAEEFDRDFDAREYAEEDRPPDALTALLEQLALASAVDGYGEGGDVVTLMTVHNSKGLEYDDVFVVGLEEGIFPHSRAGDEDRGGVEEERRLCYVAMTRARRRLSLSYARRRHVFGSPQYQLRSRFLDELPRELLDLRTVERTENAPRPSQAQPSFDELAQAPPSRPRPAAASAGRYKPGMRVVHPMFGTGTVERSDGSGDDEKLVVLFQRYGVKKLVARFARLEVA